MSRPPSLATLPTIPYSMEQEFPPAQTRFNAVRRRAAVQIFRLDLAHSLRVRVANIKVEDQSGLASLAN